MKIKVCLVIFIALLTIYLIYIYSSDNPNFKKRLINESCIIVVEIPPMSFKSDMFKTKGYSPTINKACECIHYNRWWTSYKNEIDIGDTIVKKKGELIFSIHKKDTIINHHLKL